MREVTLSPRPAPPHPSAGPGTYTSTSHAGPGAQGEVLGADGACYRQLRGNGDALLVLRAGLPKLAVAYPRADFPVTFAQFIDRQRSRLRAAAALEQAQQQ